MKRSLFGRFASLTAAAALASGMLTVLGFGLSATTASAATTPICNYTSATATVATTGGGTFILGVASGTVIKVDCNTSVAPFGAAEASLLAGIGTTTVSGTNEGDTSTLATFTASTTDTGCPAATAGSCSVATFTVPATFAAPDANAKCAPTTAQINDGLLPCVLAVVNSKLAPLGEALMVYASSIGAPPASPTVSSTKTYAVPGDTIPLSGGGWWAQAVQAIQAAETGTTAATAPTTCGSGGGYGNVPNTVSPPGFLQAFFVPSTGTPVASTPVGVDIANDCYDGTTLNGPTLSGSVPVPALAAGTYTVAICELNPWHGAFNGNDSTGICGAAPSGTDWLTASTGAITIPTAPTATATPNTGSNTNAITVAGTGFDPQGSTPKVAFTVGSTPDSGTCSAVASDGTVSCSIVVGGSANEPIGSDPIKITQGALSASAAFTVSSLSTHCSILTTNNFTLPTSCDPSQVVSVTLQGNPAIGVTISETSPFVNLNNGNPITLNGANQTATGALQELTVNDATGAQPGWTVTGAFETAAFACAQTTGSTAVDCSGNTADKQIPIVYFGWNPTLTLAGSTSNIAAGGIIAGPAVTPAAVGANGAIPTTGGFAGDVNPGAPGSPDTSANVQTICQAGVGNSGGTTLCDGTVSLNLPAYLSSGTYTDTLDITLSAG